MTTPAAHLTVGRTGEHLAARYLVKRGLSILSRNWRCPEGELDLVATDGHTLYFCEIKTRTSTHHGHPAEAVTDPKAHRIRRLARRWQHSYDAGRCPTRFDIVSILWPRNQTPRVKVHPGAF
jgi:putative endonuclease